MLLCLWYQSLAVLFGELDQSFQTAESGKKY